MRYSLPREVKSEIKKRNILHKEYHSNLQNGKVDLELERKYKKQKNYCNKLIKTTVREKRGQNITSSSDVKQIWKSISDVLNPEGISKNSLKIETEDQIIESPLELAEVFNSFFKNKVEKLSSGIKNHQKIDPLSKLRIKLQGSELNFKLKTVSEDKVLAIMKSLKSKKSFGHDNISSEILKLGADVLVVPLTYIINTSIKTGKYPTNWKIAKVIGTQ